MGSTKKSQSVPEQYMVAGIRGLRSARGFFKIQNCSQIPLTITKSLVYKSCHESDRMGEAMISDYFRMIESFLMYCTMSMGGSPMGW
jgi:hypothetical protein